MVEFGAMVASKFINTQHEAQTTKQDQKIPQAREKERRHDSADRLLGVLHTPELNQTSNPTYTTGLRDEGSEFGEPTRFDTAGGKDDDVQDHCPADQDRVLVARMACTS